MLADCKVQKRTKAPQVSGIQHAATPPLQL